MNENIEAEVVERRQANGNHEVLVVKGGGSLYQREPCIECPWRRQTVGSFPAEVFRLSAPAAYDAATRTIACHMSGAQKPAICAGFLLRNADNNVAVRIHTYRGTIDLAQVEEAGADLFDNYREMAVANGVDPDDPVLGPCRGNDEDFVIRPG